MDALVGELSLEIEALAASQRGDTPTDVAAASDR